MAKKEKSLMRQLIDERGIKDVAGVQALVKELTAGLIQECMDAELEDDLGYSKYDYRNKETDNSRNGTYKKTVSSSQGDVELEVPRDRNGEYEPQIVKKHQMDISAIEDTPMILIRVAVSAFSRKNKTNAIIKFNVIFSWLFSTVLIVCLVMHR